ncbi:tetratricopeptide repeat protein [bacterium]|nr:tetratricopeptide repeat protein [bacterium]
MKRMIVILFLLEFAIILNAQQKTPEIFISEARALRADSLFQAAINLLLEGVEVYPFDSDIHLQLGLAWGDLAQQGGEEGDMMNDMMTAMKGLKEAFAEFEKAVSLSPTNYNAHFYFGAYGVDVPAFFGKLDEGVAHLETAKALLEEKFPDGQPEAFAALYRFLGQGYFMQERFAEAQAAWEKVLELTPEGEHSEAAQIGLEELKKQNAINESEN